MKRFYKIVAVGTGEGGGFTVLLDDKPVRTPGRRLLEVPGRALADEIAGEWAAQEEEIVPDRMPLTQLTATALDRVSVDPEGYVGRIAAYAETDLVCYRAPAPAELAERQARIWQPLVDWVAEAFAAPLAVTDGIAPLAQPESALANMRAAVAAHDRYELAALGSATSVSGSMVVALALSHGRIDATAAFAACQIDEDFQAEQWGTDDDAAEQRALAQRDLAAAQRFFELYRAG